MRLKGAPVEIRYRPGLVDTAGNPAHAATFIRERLIVLDDELRHDPAEHARILIHELFHFVWIRLGNPRRLAWEALLVAEWNSHTRGEAGWSAEWRKRNLTARDLAGRTRRWREYCCESFCDTAAWIHTASPNEVTLSPSRLRGRKAWFAKHLGGRDLPI